MRFVKSARWGPSARLTSERVWRRRLHADVALSASRKHAHQGSTAVDVGAESGLYSLAMRRAVGRGGRVISFEPNPDSFQELSRRTWASGVDRRQLAVSEDAGLATLHVPVGAIHDRDLAGLGSLASVVHGADDSVELTTHEVRSIILDSLLEEELPPTSLVKIDVEGWEREVLAGSEKLIETFHPSLIVEIESRHLQPRGIDPRELIESILDLDYSVVALSPRGPISWRDFRFELHQRVEYLDSASDESYVNNFLFTATV
ncbi:MAG: FkbM family methyltransferase [Acidimicrobiales bacterium]